jgi:hypothetical protein
MRNSKVFIVFLAFFGLMALSYFTSCAKSTPSQSGPQSTATYTQTATNTPVQAAQTHFYTFDSGTDGWTAVSPNITMEGYGISVAQNTNPAYCYGGSSGSLQLNTDFTQALQFNAVACIDLGGNQDLEYHTITAEFYAPAGLAAATNPVTVGLYLWFADAGFYYVGDMQNITSAGWYSLQVVVQTYCCGLAYYQHVPEIGIVLNKGTSSTVNYVGPVYIDQVAW